MSRTPYIAMTGRERKDRSLVQAGSARVFFEAIQFASGCREDFPVRDDVADEEDLRPSGLLGPSDSTAP